MGSLFGGETHEHGSVTETVPNGKSNRSVRNRFRAALFKNLWRRFFLDKRKKTAIIILASGERQCIPLTESMLG